MRITTKVRENSSRIPEEKEDVATTIILGGTVIGHSEVVRLKHVLKSDGVPNYDWMLSGETYVREVVGYLYGRPRNLIDFAEKWGLYLYAHWGPGAGVDGGIVCVSPESGRQEVFATKWGKILIPYPVTDKYLRAAKIVQDFRVPELILADVEEEDHEDE